MTDFFKSNPIALRHCLLYEYLQKNPIEKSFIALHKTFGPDIIEKKMFNFWFYQFTQGVVFDKKEDKKPIAGMKNVLQSDKYALRACILYESLKYKLAERGSSINSLWPHSKLTVNEIRSNPSFAMYKMFCKVVGKAVMEYQEFDFWFYRFVNGEHELNYERDKEEKTYELMEMPVDVIGNIVEYLDIFDRMKLAKTSRSLQTFVEDQKLFIHTLDLFISHRMAIVSFGNSVYIEYVREGDDCVKHYKKRKTFVRGVAYWKQALLDLRSVFKNPKLHLNTLEIDLDIEDDHKIPLDDLEDALKFTHYLNVKNVFLEEYSWGLLAKTLPSIKPGYLKTININSHNPSVDSMNSVFETEQWKQAKCFTMKVPCFIWPLSHLFHFKEFTVTLNELSVEDLREMKKILFKSPDFEKCSMTVSREIDTSIFEQEFGNAHRANHNPILNSTEYFEIKVKEYSFKKHFEVTRKKC